MIPAQADQGYQGHEQCSKLGIPGKPTKEQEQLLQRACVNICNPAEGVLRDGCNLGSIAPASFHVFSIIANSYRYERINSTLSYTALTGEIQKLFMALKTLARYDKHAHAVQEIEQNHCDMTVAFDSY